MKFKTMIYLFLDRLGYVLVTHKEYDKLSEGSWNWSKCKAAGIKKVNVRGDLTI